MTIDNEIIRIRRHIHQYPETGGNEYKTADFIESKLKALKIPYKRVSKTGVIGVLKGAKAGKTVALRADIDALPVQEDNKIEYKSKNNDIMHACGHDAHTAIMLGVAKSLSVKKNKLNGNVKFLFQPSEETADGAQNLIKEGALKNPDADVILGVHVCPWIKSGKIGLRYGEMMAAVDKLKIDIEGEMSHGAYPHLGKDALIAAMSFINSTQHIISREVNPVFPAVITFGKITGGDGYNIICENIAIEGTVRTLNNEVRKLVKESIIRKLKVVELAYGVKYKLRYQAVGNPLINTKEITEFCHKTAKEFYGKTNIVIIDKPSMGGEDFAEYLNEVPGNFMYIGTSKNKATSYPWHHSNFNIDETALPKAAKYIEHSVESFFKK
ncbi:MAG: amidohydrolase [Endomicrobium sp.]|jgi:amidohydrolase|nr:amidohydrolase [Endomicrobium sp.]